MMKMTNYAGKPLRKNSTEVAAIKAIQAAVLMFVTFCFFISISSAQAKMSNQQCLNKIEELDEKYGFQEGEYTADDYKYKYAKVIQMIKLMEDGCANSVPVVKKFGKIDIADGKSYLETIRAKCEKVTGDPNCGYTQTTKNPTANNPKTNNTSSAKSTSSTNDAAEASKVLASFGTSSQSKSCLRQKPRGDDLVITDACPSPNRHVDTNFFYCLIGIKDAKRNDAECGGPKFSKWIGGGEHGEANRYASRQIRNKSDTYISSRGAKKLMMTACRTPYTPTNISYSQQGGLTSECKWCDSWLKDGKNTCAKEIKTLQNN